MGAFCHGKKRDLPLPFSPWTPTWNIVKLFLCIHGAKKTVAVIHVFRKSFRAFMVRLESVFYKVSEEIMSHQFRIQSLVPLWKERVDALTSAKEGGKKDDSHKLLTRVHQQQLQVLFFLFEFVFKWQGHDHEVKRGKKKNVLHRSLLTETFLLRR